MRGPIEQTYHVLYEVLFFLGSIFSRTLNAVFFQGSMHQTLSSRAHIESLFSDRWLKIRSIINGIFFWQEDHCRTSWESEVLRAKKTLQRNSEAGAYNATETTRGPTRTL